MLVRILVYTGGAGIDAPWLVVEGDEPFFRITKRIHHKPHGMPGDGPLPATDRRHYERVMAANAGAMSSRVRPGDVVVLNDPQTLGLAESVRRCGAAVVWRNHIGADRANEDTEQGWAFLRPYLAAVERCLRRWRSLSDRLRDRIRLVSLSMADVEENARIVNAIQRRATIVVQKSLAEGFGLTVTEAMWKQKPVLASAVGGIQDQIVHG